MLRAAARRPPPQLLSSALSCTNTTGWQPRLRQNMNGFYEEMELQEESSFFNWSKYIYRGLDNYIQGDFSTAPPQDY